MVASTAGVLTTDYLVVGAGLAGLMCAIKASEKGAKVVVLSKGDLGECNTSLAQGGIACKVLPDDTFESHVEDTLRAGAGLCDLDAVDNIVRNAPARIQDLIRCGVKFTTAVDDQHTPRPRSPAPSSSTDERDSAFDLGREGGHSARRILHAGDITGAEVMRALMEEVTQRRPSVTVLSNHAAIDLITTQKLQWPGENVCIGAYVLDRKTETVKTVAARVGTFLCTGGAGKVYLYTTNPNCATGDGIAMAWRAHAQIANMEFYQFHPTCLYHPKVKSFLISEALRGEQAKLKVRDAKTGEFTEFMSKYHPMADLAPRDVVARAIDKELKRTGEPCVFLDIRHHPEAFLRRRFPNIFAKLEGLGINMAKDLIPVVPAAHYCCGGIRTNVHGVTSIEGLYAVGECGYTGLHGANRLASNSLLEAAVVAANAVEWAAGHPRPDRTSMRDSVPGGIPLWSVGKAVDSDELVVVTHCWEEIRRFMWDYVGIFRTTKRLKRAKARVELLRHEIEQYYWACTITTDLIELRNLASVAEMIVDSALQRKESIGLHFNADFPPAGASSVPAQSPRLTWVKDTVLVRTIPVTSQYRQAGQPKVPFGAPQQQH